MKKTGKIISILALTAVMLISALCFVACGDKKKPTNDGGKITYTITVQRSSGDKFTSIPVVAYDKDHNIAGYASTDDKGVATFTAAADTYTLEFGLLPEGYKGKDNYTITKDNPTKTFTLSASLISEPAAADHKYKAGSVMHDFTFVDSTGKQGSLSEVLKTKKAVLLNFWFIECSWCVKEFPDMQTAYAMYSDDIEIIGLNFTDGKSSVENFRKDVNNYYDWEELTFPMVSNENVCTAELCQAFSVVGCPTSVMIDREGVVCMVEEGYNDLDGFKLLFEEFTKEPYTQNIYFEGESGAVKPNVAAPSSAEIESAINNTQSGFTYSYRLEEDEYNWPWIIDGNSIKASNAGYNNSFAILNTEFTATDEQVLAFDYKTSSEEDADFFYVFIDNILMQTYSGVSDTWNTCYAYVPISPTGSYTLSLVYMKDSRNASGDDTVYVKNMRFTQISSIDEYTEMVRPCAYGQIENNRWSNYVQTVYNEDDGYYHVGEKDGPLVLADLMNPTNWSNKGAWDYVSGNKFEYDTDGDGTAEDLTDAFTEYTQYSTNSRKYGLIAVTKELKGLLDAFTAKYSEGHENAWLELCTYYSVYCGEPLRDPTEGVSYYTAFEAILNTNEQSPVYNTVVKHTILMPRGVWFKFVPAETAIYNVHSVGEIDSFGWVVNENLEFIADNDDDPNYDGDPNGRFNFSITILLEQGKTYYILCDFNAPETMGTFDFVLNKVGTKGNVWVSACSGEYTQVLDENENVIGVELKDAVEFVLGEDDCYHVKNADGSAGPMLYIDLANTTNLFPDLSVEQMVNMNRYYCTQCGYPYPSSVKTFEETEKPLCFVCGAEGKNMFEKRKVFELPTPRRDAEGNVFVITIEYDDGTYTELPVYELNTDQSLLVSDYLTDIKEYGIKFTDYTETVKTYIANSKLPGYYPDEEEVGGNGKPHTGFIAASKELVDIITKFIIFGDYGYSPTMDNVWLMMAKYYMYLE